MINLIELNEINSIVTEKIISLIELQSYKLNNYRENDLFNRIKSN